ncbi:MAG: sugar ABC transporter permease [Clostridia bacterium]|nr:sugar ABC transporter permease [Clostridia bacterium]
MEIFMKGSLATAQGYVKPSFGSRLKADFRGNYQLYIMLIPVVAYFLLFHYKPMYGAIIAFKDFNPRKGVLGSDWVGLEHFASFITDPYFGRIVGNTLIISLSTLIFGFPAPIILALLMNEIRCNLFKRTVQTLTYLPHFISLVVICGMIRDFTMDNGVITVFLSYFGFPRETMLNKPNLFVPVYVISEIWQTVGWGSIVYLAALTGIDMELYEAAELDGAGRWKQTIHITLPSIIPTIMVMLILRMGSMLNVGYEKIILLYNEAIYSTSDVISSYVYRRGLLQNDYSFSTAVGLFNSVINFLLLIAANQISKRANDSSLW